MQFQMNAVQSEIKQAYANYFRLIQTMCYNIAEIFLQWIIQFYSLLRTILSNSSYSKKWFFV